MELEEKINKTLEGLKRTPEHLEDWKELRKKLKKMGQEFADCLIYKVDPIEAKKILNILNRLETLYGYKTIDKSTSDPYREPFDNLITLSNLEGDVLDMLDILHKAGHSLSKQGVEEEHLKNKAKAYFGKRDVDYFKELIKDGLYKKYSKILTLLQEELGLSIKNGWAYFKEIDDIIELSKTEGDICGTIYLLSSKGYHIVSPGIITKKDVEGIKEVAESILKEGLDPAIMVCLDLYKREDNERFKKYFPSLENNKKKEVITALFKQEEDNKEIQKWLEDLYDPLVKEAGMYL